MQEQPEHITYLNHGKYATTAGMQEHVSQEDFA